VANLAPACVTLSTGQTTWTNQPAALTEFLGGTLYRAKCDLSLFDTARLCARVNAAGAVNAVLGVQYSTDEVTWTTLCSVGVGSTGTKAGAWATIPAAAQADVVLRLGGQSGDGVADPAFGLIALEMYNAGGTMERQGLADQIVANVYGLTRNWRDNATGYSAALTAGQTPQQVAAVMVADANEYIRRLGWMQTAFTNNAAVMGQALTDMGLTTAQAQALDAALTAVANHTKAADLSTAAAVNAEVTYILANVPNYARLW
jgi:hypothetical protein